MLGIVSLPIFISSGILLNITPGPDMLCVLSRSARYGWKHGCYCAFGVGAGCFFHLILSGLGLTALLAIYPSMLFSLKLLGALYLIYLGICLCRQRNPTVGVTEMPLDERKVSRIQSFSTGCLTNILNPKVFLFFVAFLPQFIDPTFAHQGLTFFILGVIFIFNGTLINLAVALFANLTLSATSSTSTFSAWANTGIGAVFVFYGVSLILNG